MDSRKLIKWWEADGVWAMVDVDIPRFDGKVEKINNTLPHRLPGCIDNYVKARGETRSGLLAEAARRAMQGGALIEGDNLPDSPPLLARDPTSTDCAADWRHGIRRATYSRSRGTPCASRSSIAIGWVSGCCGLADAASGAIASPRASASALR